MYKQISLLILFSLFYISHSLISDYTPIIGRDLLTPADITRASLLTYDDQNKALTFAKSIQIETPMDVFNITFSNFYLNNIISLSNNNAFGAQSHYNNLISLYNGVNNLSLIGLNNSINYINTISKFTNMDTSKFQKITTSINDFKSNITSMQQIANSLAVAINNTKNTLPVNSPNSEVYKIVIDNYQLVIGSIVSISTHLEDLKTPLTEINSYITGIQNEVDFYLQFISTDQEYMASMNSFIKLILYRSNTFYSRSLLLTRLKDFF
ncbi:hypothetical protein RB653_008110 [Dictyostelium firmibasis]|uniref:Uncharacterized protein n=1 Tax=Dictyostelium firmibasis TaxID=79012 RepID=A0AAN7TS30_9MYCE